MSANLNLGQLITDPDTKRDACHVAVAPVTAGGNLAPGMYVHFIDGKVYQTDHQMGIGIIDPFLFAGVKKGERCWLWLKPGSVISLRHHYSHPSLPEEDAIPTADKEQDEFCEKNCAPSAYGTGAIKRNEAEAWLRAFATRYDMDYDVMIQEAKYDDYITVHSVSVHSNAEMGEDYHLFWDNISSMGFPDRRQVVEFTCSC